MPGGGMNLSDEDLKRMGAPRPRPRFNHETRTQAQKQPAPRLVPQSRGLMARIVRALSIR